MSNDRPAARFPSPSQATHGLLHGLIQALHDLVIRVSSRLRHRQMHHSPMEHPKGEFDIWERLGGHVETVSAGSRAEARPCPRARGRTTEPGRDADAAPSAQLFNGLTEHRRRGQINQLLPRIDERLQNSTMEHINVALILAHEGNADGARLHIGLAEHAMHTASRFASDEDYEAFKIKVENRLASVVDTNQPPAHGA